MLDLLFYKRMETRTMPPPAITKGKMGKIPSGRPLLLLKCTILLATVSLPAQGEDSPQWLEDLHVQGAIWQGFSHTSNNQVFGPSDDTLNPQLHGLLMAAQWRMKPWLRWDGQISWVQYGDASPKDFNVNVFSFDFNLYSQKSTSLGIRAGRIRNHTWLYNEIRDVPFTRPTIFLPQSIYLERGRYAVSYGDVVNGYFTTPVGNGMVRVDASYGKVTSDNYETGFLGRDLPGETKTPFESYILRLRYTNHDNTLTLNAVTTTGIVDYEPGENDPISCDGQMRYSPSAFAAQWSPNPRWVFTGEIAFTSRSFDNLEAVPTAIDASGLSWYTQAEYRIRPDLSLTLRYDSYTVDQGDPDGEEIEASQGVPKHFMFARDWTIGLGWMPSPNWLLQLEYHNVDGTGWVDYMQDPATLSRRWDMVAAQVAYRFRLH